VLIAFTYIQVMANLRLPDYMAKIINEGIVAKDNAIIIDDGIRMIAVSFIGVVCAVGVGFLAARIATGFSKSLREKTFAKVESFSLSEFNNFSTASLITRTTNDVQQIQTVTLMFFRMVLMAPIMAVGALQKAYQNAPSMSWLIVVAVVCMFCVIITLFGIGIPRFQLLQKLVDKLNLVTRENLTGLRVIRAFNNEAKEEEKFEKANTDLTKMNLFVNRLMAMVQPIMILILNFATLGVVWFGAHLIDANNLQIGNMMAFMQYSIQTIMSFLMISIIFIMFPRASVSTKRIAEILKTPLTIKEPKKPVNMNSRVRGLVEFKEVTFSYPDADLPVLTDISFTAEPGQTTAFIGSTGSGKSTIINLIPRFYDVTAGQILLDGVDIRDIKLEDLRNQLGYVPQKGVLFSGTIKSNIKYGREKTTDEEVKQAAQTAQADEFIDKIEDKYDSFIAQGGANVSGGQKQRLSIARALAKDAKVYIFDDSFSALDFKTDAKLRADLAKQTKDKTVIIIGQRIGSIMNADKIIVIDEGKIVGQGTHENLLKTNEVYREIAFSQLSDKELKTISNIKK